VARIGVYPKSQYSLHFTIYFSNTDIAFSLECSSALPRKYESGSSVSVVSDYGLDDRALRLDSRQRKKDFSSILCVQNRSEAHPASCTMDTRGSSPRAKARPGRDADHSPHLAPASRISRSYTSSPTSAFLACSGTALAFYSGRTSTFVEAHFHVDTNTHGTCYIMI
jgi:hypothetical protein